MYCWFFFLMIRRPPRSTRTDTLFPYTTLFRSMVPAGTPKPIIDKIHAETVRILADPAIKKRLLAMGAEPVGNTPDEMGKRIKSEVAKFGELIDKAKISAKAN